MYFCFRYKPKAEEELLLFLNALDELLLSKAPAVLVMTVKLFLHWTEDHPHLKKDMLEMIQPSMCKILGRNIPESSYLVLDFLSTLSDIRTIFGAHYKYFLVRAKDPSYLKTKKLKVLPLVSTESNVCCLIEEVKPYCSDYQSFRDAVNCLGMLGQTNFAANKLCLSILVTLLDAPTERVVVSALECLLNVFPLFHSENEPVSQPQKAAMQVQDSPIADSEAAATKEEEFDLVPSKYTDVPIAEIPQNLPSLPQELTEAVTRALSRSSVQEAAPSLVLHVVGTLAPYIDAAPDILQQISSLSMLSKATHADLVSTAACIFLAKPAQSQLLLAGILAKAFKVPGAPASRAALVYSALLEDPTDAAKLFGAEVRPLVSNSHQFQVGTKL